MTISALAYFGTSGGFNFKAVGDHRLSSARVVGMFDTMGFTSIEIPARTKVWGFFKRSTEVGVVVGIALYERVDEYTLAQAGNYMGVGLLLQNASVDAKQVVFALGEFHEYVSQVALNQSEFDFPASRFSDLPEVNIPQSCLDILAHLTPAIPTSSFASLTFNKICINAQSAGIPLLLYSLLKYQYVIPECRVFISDDSKVVEAFIQSGRKTIDDMQILEMLKAGSKNIKSAEERMNLAEKRVKEAEQHVKEAEIDADDQRDGDGENALQTETQPDATQDMHYVLTGEPAPSSAAQSGYMPYAAQPEPETIYFDAISTENELRQMAQDEVKSQLASFERKLGIMLRRGIIISALVGLTGGVLGSGIGTLIAKVFAGNNNTAAPIHEVLSVSTPTDVATLTPAVSAVSASPDAAVSAPLAPPLSSKSDRAYLGIYAGRNKVDYFLHGGTGHDQAQFANTQDGFLDFKDWLDSHGRGSVQVCVQGAEPERMELVKYLQINNMSVKIIDAREAELFEMKQRNTSAPKDDPKIIAEFCASDARLQGRAF